MAQGLKKWHRDSEWQCSHTVLRLEACSSALSPLCSSLKGHFPSFSFHRPHRCYLLCWLRCGAAELSLAYRRSAACQSILSPPLQQSVAFNAGSNSVLLSQTGGWGPDPPSNPSYLPHPSSCSHVKSSLRICSDHPFPSVVGNLEERERCCHIFYSLGMDSLLSLC